VKKKSLSLGCVSCLFNLSIVFLKTHPVSLSPATGCRMPGHDDDPEQAFVSGSSIPSNGQSQYPSLIHDFGISSTALRSASALEFQPPAHLRTVSAAADTATMGEEGDQDDVDDENDDSSGASNTPKLDGPRKNRPKRSINADCRCCRRRHFITTYYSFLSTASKQTMYR
jgi:hypothetical protein